MRDEVRAMVTAFSQRDPRWADERLGTSPLCMAEAGCLVTAVASLLTDFGAVGDLGSLGGMNPGALNAWLVAHGGFVDGCRFVFGAVEPLGARLRAWVDYYSTPANLTRIGRALAAGWGALALVDARPGADVQAHWVRLVAVLTGPNGSTRDCEIMDPWQRPGGELGSLRERYGGQGWQAGRAIFVYVGYERVPQHAGARGLVRGAARRMWVQDEVSWWHERAG
jgi:hypothetical protein